MFFLLEDLEAPEIHLVRFPLEPPSLRWDQPVQVGRLDRASLVLPEDQTPHGLQPAVSTELVQRSQKYDLCPHSSILLTFPGLIWQNKTITT